MYRYLKLFVFIVTRTVAIIFFGFASFLRALVKIVLPRFLFYQNVTGKVVLITGGASGLGREIALLFAKRGACVVSWDINEKENEVTADLIRKKGGKCFPYAVDITFPDATYEAAEQVEAEVGKVDILINNAGLMGDLTPIQDASDFTIRKVFQVNVLSLFWITKAFLPGMINRQSGQIVNIGSISGKTGWHQAIDYSSSKFAVTGFCESLRRQIKIAGYKGIDVMLICPAFVKTPMTSTEKLKSYPMTDLKYAAKEIVQNVLTKTSVHIFPSILKALPLIHLIVTRETVDLAYSFIIQGLHLSTGTSINEDENS